MYIYDIIIVVLWQPGIQDNHHCRTKFNIGPTGNAFKYFHRNHWFFWNTIPHACAWM